MKIYLSLLLFFLSVITYSQNRNWLSDEAQNCLSQEYQYESSLTRSLDEDEVAYINAYKCFLQYIKSEDKESLRAFEKAQGNLIRLAKTNNTKISMMMINLDIQYGLLKLIKGDEVSGIYSIYSAYKSFQSLDKDECNQLEYQKLNGLFLIFADQVQAQKYFVSWLLGIEGDEKLGFQLLRSYLNQTRYQHGLHKEGLLLLAYGGLQFSDLDKKELQGLMGEADRYSSPLLSFVIAMNAFKTNQTEWVYQWTSNWNEAQLNSFPLLGYARGRMLLNTLDEAGKKDLEWYVNQGLANSYVADALFRLARFAHVKGDYAKRNLLISRIQLQKSYPTSFDKQALAELDYLKLRPAALVKARFLFDAGDYLTALSILNTDSLISYEPFYQVEWWYRVARSEHMLNHMDSALIAYNKVIDLTEDDDRYYGPYAALFSAEIYHDKNNIKKTLYYLEKADELNTGEYKKDLSVRIENLSEEIE